MLRAHASVISAAPSGSSSREKDKVNQHPAAGAGPLAQPGRDRDPARRRDLTARIERIFIASRGTYGCRRIVAELNHEGRPASVGLVADLMRGLGLKACRPRAYKRATVPGDAPVTSPDLLGRDFTAPEPGQRLVVDITYLRTGEGWLYLATVIDLATRMVVGWQLADQRRTSLVTDALAMAGHRRPRPPGVVFHSARGCQGDSTGRRNTSMRRWMGGSTTGLGRCGDGQAGDAVPERPPVERRERHFSSTSG